MLLQLNEREANIIRMRFGLDNEKPMTLEEVGLVFNITRERVRQLQNMALSKMRKSLTKNERQRNAEEIREEQLKQQRMEVLQEFFQSKIEEKNGDE